MILLGELTALRQTYSLDFWEEERSRDGKERKTEGREMEGKEMEGREAIGATWGRLLPSAEGDERP